MAVPCLALAAVYSWLILSNPSEPPVIVGILVGLVLLYLLPTIIIVISKFSWSGIATWLTDMQISQGKRREAKRLENDRQRERNRLEAENQQKAKRIQLERQELLLKEQQLDRERQQSDKDRFRNACLDVIAELNREVATLDRSIRELSSAPGLDQGMVEEEIVILNSKRQQLLISIAEQAKRITEFK